MIQALLWRCPTAACAGSSKKQKWTHPNSHQPNSKVIYILSSFLFFSLNYYYLNAVNQINVASNSLIFNILIISIIAAKAKEDKKKETAKNLKEKTDKIDKDKKDAKLKAKRGIKDSALTVVEGDKSAEEDRKQDEKDDKQLKDIENAEDTVNRSCYTLEKVNFSVKKGQLLAIVGSVGSGKSSLLSGLLGMKLHNPISSPFIPFYHLLSPLIPFCSIPFYSILPLQHLLLNQCP